MELEADEFELNNNVRNERNETDSEAEKNHSITETLFPVSNIWAHLMYSGENIEAFDSLKKHRKISIQTNRYY